MIQIQLQNVNKWYGPLHVLRDVNLEVSLGERIVICGPSGSGKSTMIRCINRLEQHQNGRIIVDGVELNGDVRESTRCAARSAWSSSSSISFRT